MHEQDHCGKVVAPRSTPSRHRRALLVGVERTATADLWGPRNNVALVRSTICAAWDFETTVLLDRDATRDGILQAFEAMATRAQPGDVLLFYFAGHGTRVPSRHAASTVHEALCPHDLAHDLQTGAIEDHELHVLFDEVQTRGAELTAIFDCCFAGGLPSQHQRGTEVVVFGACAADAVAKERRFAGVTHGVFTHHLAAAAGSLAPGFTNGDLHERTAASMLAAHRGDDDPQRPTLDPPTSAGDVFLGHRSDHADPPGEM